MKMNQLLAGVSAALAATIIVGCSAHENPPQTPYIIATTPTYRATVNSTDPVTAPFYMTPGVNGGQVVAAPSLPAQDRFNANSPLAVSVYVAIAHSAKVDPHYITVEGKANAVRLQGTVRTAAQRAEVDSIARLTPGVKSVVNNIAVL